jgi:hypothetical protein
LPPFPLFKVRRFFREWVAGRLAGVFGVEGVPALLVLVLGVSTADDEHDNDTADVWLGGTTMGAMVIR